MIQIDAKADVTSAVNALVELGVNAEKAGRAVLGAVAKAVQKRVRNRMGGYLKRRTGWLRQHVYAFRRSETHYVVSAPKYKSEILARGGTINTKKKKWLTFKVNGEWRKVKSVTIPARKWFTSSVDGFENDGEVKLAVDKAVQKIVDKFNKDRGIA